jgi:hypothetical protein
MLQDKVELIEKTLTDNVLVKQQQTRKTIQEMILS